MLCALLQSEAERSQKLYREAEAARLQVQVMKWEVRLDVEGMSEYVRLLEQFGCHVIVACCVYSTTF